MEQSIFIGMDPLAKIRALEDNAVEIAENYEWEQPLTPEELDEYREKFAGVHIELAALEARKKALLEEITREMKDKKTVSVSLLKVIRTERKDLSGRAFFIQDFKEGIIGIYNSDGELIGQRKMRKTEAQGRIFQTDNGPDTVKQSAG